MSYGNQGFAMIVACLFVSLVTGLNTGMQQQQVC